MCLLQLSLYSRYDSMEKTGLLRGSDFAGFYSGASGRAPGTAVTASGPVSDELYGAFVLWIGCKTAIGRTYQEHRNL